MLEVTPATSGVEAAVRTWKMRLPTHARLARSGRVLITLACSATDVLSLSGLRRAQADPPGHLTTAKTGRVLATTVIARAGLIGTTLTGARA